jgi:hypothetical protein
MQNRTQAAQRMIISRITLKCDEVDCGNQYEDHGATSWTNAREHAESRGWSVVDFKKSQSADYCPLHKIKRGDSVKIAKTTEELRNTLIGIPTKDIQYDEAEMIKAIETKRLYPYCAIHGGMCTSPNKREHDVEVPQKGISYPYNVIWDGSNWLVMMLDGNYRAL